MIISLMFLTGMLARIAVSNAVKSVTAVVAWILPQGQAKAASPSRKPQKRQAKAAPPSGRKPQKRQAKAARPSGRKPHQRTRFSRPKRRHPHQVMQWKDLEVGREYTFVHVRECDGRMFEYRRMFVGAFSGKPMEHDLPPKTNSHRGHYENMVFTVHLDGWSPWNFSMDSPLFIIWGGDGRPCTYGYFKNLFEHNLRDDQHEILVPSDEWQNNPRVDVDWTEKMPNGDYGEMVWMYDKHERRQCAGIISGKVSAESPEPVSASGEPMYHVEFVRTSQKPLPAISLPRNKLTVRRVTEPIDEIWAAKLRARAAKLRARTIDRLRV